MLVRLNYLVATMLLGAVAGSGQTVAAAQSRASRHAAPGYVPITVHERFKWFAKSTTGPESLAAGVFSAGFGTDMDNPREYGPHWDGFGKRYEMRLTGISTGNAMEAGLGSLWGEDPRYFQAAGQPFKQRLKNVAVLTFAARRADGSLAPAYARYLGNAGNNFLSNSWRADSEASTGDACLRILLGFAGK